MLMCLWVCDHRNLTTNLIKVANQWLHYKSVNAAINFIANLREKLLRNKFKIVLQWNALMGYDSPFFAAKINSLSEMTGMTVPIQMQRGGSMAVLQPPRSRFMINDILGGGGKLRSETDDDERTPSPQPRDLSIPSNSMRNHQHDDSDDDQSDSSMLDDSQHLQR